MNELLKELKALRKEAYLDLNRWSRSDVEGVGRIWDRYVSLCYKIRKGLVDIVWTITLENGKTVTANGTTMFLINIDSLNGVDTRGFRFGHELNSIKSIEPSTEGDIKC